jgi:serine protease Do
MVEPAVVNINTESIIKEQSRTRRRSPYGGEPQEPFDFFERFFGGPMDGPNREMKTKALGSGFIVDKSGYIVTNFHVVDKADKINVSLPSGDEYPAKVIGKDSVSAMQSGIFWGYVGLIDSLVRRIRAEYGEPMKVIAAPIPR